VITRAECEERDAADPLAHLRERFLLPPGVIYLDGNSLGALPAGVPERIRITVEEQWGKGLIRSWNDAGWVDLPRRVGDRIAGLVGARPGTVVACDSTSINLFKSVEAALTLAPDRRVILTDSGNFPTDLYVMAGVAARHGMEVRSPAPEEVAGSIDGEVAMVALTQVDYRTGRLHDLPEITALAHAAGALSVWDLAHSAGVMPIDLEAAGVDLAVGCGYKYLNGGPGAPAFLYVAPRHLERFHNPIQGWFGHVAPFEFRPDFEAAPGVDRARVGTPHLLSLAALDAALDAFDDVDLREVRVKSVDLTELFLALVDERLDGMGFTVASPRAPSRRGSQVSLRHPEGYAIVQALIERGVIGDFRAPDLCRFGFSPPYLRFVDVWDAVDELVEVMANEVWRDGRHRVRSAVT
jgi:kynureninase